VRTTSAGKVQVVARTNVGTGESPDYTDVVAESTQDFRLNEWNDVIATWEGMQWYVYYSMEHLFKNNIGWYTDPDGLCVRPPGTVGDCPQEKYVGGQTLEEARVWTTFVGITGQLLMASDQMYSLPEERVELLRRVFPVADIRSVDLYPYHGARPRIYDLRISKPGVGEWDVVALFTWELGTDPVMTIDPERLGLREGWYVYYDQWRKELLGVSRTAFDVDVPAHTCRLISVRPFTGEPQLIATSRHITQGADDLEQAVWDADTGVWSGHSHVVGDDPYELRFLVPPGWIVVTPECRREGALAVLTLRTSDNQLVPWQVEFRRESVQPASAPDVTVTCHRYDDDHVSLDWSGVPGPDLGYRVYRDGRFVAVTGDTRFAERLPGGPGSRSYEVAALGWGGAEVRSAPVGVDVSVTHSATPDAYLLDLDPVSVIQYGPERAKHPYVCRRDATVAPNTSVDGNTLTIADRTFERGLGVLACSEISYELAGRYRELRSWIGLDDEVQGGAVVFKVVADGETVFESPVVFSGDEAREICVPLVGARSMTLVVSDAGDVAGFNWNNHADWADARVIGWQQPEIELESTTRSAQ
jgi:hypothetical protein